MVASINNPLANDGDASLVSGLERSLEKEMATHSCLGNPMNRIDWWAIVYWVAEELNMI